MGNRNLNKAKREKNDEFYTQREDIENELKHYRSHFKDKVIYLNCDDHRESEFFKYFAMNFEFLGIKKLISTHYHPTEPTYKLEITGDHNSDGKVDLDDAVLTKLEGNGDFRNQECIDILKEVDIVVTNPPFSLFREYVAQLIEYDKKFLIVGPMGALTYKEIFKLNKENTIWIGFNYVKKFKKPNGEIQKFGNILWHTNLDHNKRHEKFISYKDWEKNAEEFEKYDNYDAIEVSKTSDIPKNYNGIMGVPITFLEKYNPEQFEILATNAFNDKEYYGLKALYVNDKKKYTRILIKWKDEK
jgi:hypothetical protein